LSRDAAVHFELAEATISSDVDTLESFYHGARDLLGHQARALDELIHDAASHTAPVVELDHTTRCIVWMLQAVGVSIHSVLRLTESRDMAIRDCFGIARSAAETAVNVAYIAIGGSAVAERAMRHGRQKRWRDLHREGVVGGDLMISVERKLDPTMDDIPGLAEDLQEFTTKKGAEVRDWTPLNIQERIDVIHASSPEAGRLLGAAIFAIYRPSSELLHGTFYGVNYFWQGSRDTVVASAADFDRLWVEEHFITLASTLLFAASGAVEAVAAAQGWTAHIERQRSILRTLDDLTSRISPSSNSEHAFRATVRAR